MIYTESQVERFWDKVEMIPFHTCWEWTALKRGGYGRIRMGTLRSAHRVSWEITNKKQIPAKLVVLHKCDNKGCVNPDHLQIGTQLENVRDSIDKGRFGLEEKIKRRVESRKLHCHKGHPFSGKNLLVSKRDGRRFCLACCAERNRKYYKAKVTSV